jgi:hypothetical protein
LNKEGFDIDKKKSSKFLTVLLIILLIISVTAVSFSQDAYEKLEDSHQRIISDYSSLYNDHKTLTNSYNNLEFSYGTLQNKYDSLQQSCSKKNSVVYLTSDAPSTIIKNGTIYWNFYTLDLQVVTWQVPVESYRSYINYPKPSFQYLYLDKDGDMLTTYDLRGYIQSEFFDGVIHFLTDGRNAHQFVNEVVNLKNQLVSYGSLGEGGYRWAMETLTEGQGNCGDTTILVVSLLKSGNEKMNYGIEISILYCDGNQLSNPQEVNHVIVGVEYSDGYNQLIETTSDTYYLYDEVVGWKFEV